MRRNDLTWTKWLCAWCSLSRMYACAPHLCAQSGDQVLRLLSEWQAGAQSCLIIDHISVLRCFALLQFNLDCRRSKQTVCGQYLSWLFYCKAEFWMSIWWHCQVNIRKLSGFGDRLQLCGDTFTDERNVAHMKLWISKRLWLLPEPIFWRFARGFFSFFFFSLNFFFPCARGISFNLKP